MRNQEIADIFASIADLMEILGEDPFRVNSYRKSARVLEELTDDIEAVAKADELTRLPGIGKSTAEKIRQYLETGKIPLHEELRGKVPPHLPELLRVPGLGPKTAAKLWRQADITSLAKLKKAMEKDDPRLLEVEGLGAKKIRLLWEGVMFLESAGGRIRLDQADVRGAALLEVVAAKAAKRPLTVAGSLRRGKETIGDIDLLCAAEEADGAEIMSAFTKAPQVARVLASGTTKSSVVLEGDVTADLRVVPPGSFGAALQYFTGSKEHNIRLREIAVRKGWKLNEYGLFDGDKQIAGADEEGIYRALGLTFVPPELREDRGEVQAAGEGRLPKLIEPSDIRGDLHMHTTASDGANTIDEMIVACRKRGYKYLCVSEHSKSQVQANGLDADRLREHVSAIRQAAARHKGILVLAGIEVDIFKDGSLDLDDKVLGELDFVIASPHSALHMGAAEATRRIVKAIEHPCVRCIGHASGRLINARAGMEIDIETIAAAAAEHGVAMELNAHPMRLDLRDTHVRAAVEAGAMLAINTDAHGLADLDLMRYGVTTARRGWAEARHVLNTRAAAELKRWLARKKR